MTRYKLSNFTDKTPREQQTKLETQLKGIEGVVKVEMHPAKSEVSLAFRSPEAPKKEIIEAAVSKAGFALAAQR